MNEYNGVKVNTVFVGEFVSGDKIDVKTIVTKNYPLLPLSDSREWYEKRVVDATLTSLEEFQERDSGWALSRIFNLTVNVNRYNPMHAGCRVKLPREIALKKAVINVQSNDNACFAWAVVAALYPAEKNVGRESSYPHYTTVLNLKGVKFPMSLNKITRFERINDISINVELHDLALRAKTVLDIDAPMTNLTSDEWERFVNATRCSICEKPFELGDARVRDHCHLTGRYRGPAHSNCNLNYKDTYVIPVFFHNLSGYDAHFIIKDVANAFPGSVEILPITKETYISFTKNVEDAWDEGWFGKRLKLRFVDSFKFLSASLEKLASYLDKSELRIARSEFSDLSDADFELLARKGVFPYEYVDDVDKFYNLDPAYYYTLPGYTWDAMLKYTSVRFELLTDIDMVMFVERGIRGGLSQCSNRYARANNKYLQSYDSSEPSSYLMYFDINNLYGWAMCQSLPYENFRWVDNVTSVDLMSVTSDSPIGYILEVDLAYPSDLHDSHADLPFCPTRDKPPGKRDEKLLATLRSVFAEDLVAVELRKLEIKFNKPIYVGMCILDISKIRLYEFHYEYMLPLYRDKCKIMYTDTDSLIYRVECEDIYENMKRDIDKFDTSDYAMDNAYGMPLANKKIPGAMKDENAGAIMTEFIGLRAKMYALRVAGKSDTKRIKGVKSGVVARTITFDDYARCLRQGIEMKREQFCIRSELHKMYTVSELKIALSPHDDKRYTISGTTDTLPWGHYKIPL
ncbi:uncharacterized protein [Polyergus mexicanus]|uniref:uncharacterized protein n=1 Tax=Polyergus mexicanus TaxID=615972 RepID=UPI0038B4DA92